MKKYSTMPTKLTITMQYILYGFTTFSIAVHCKPTKTEMSF